MTNYRFGLLTLAILLASWLCTGCGGSSSGSNEPISDSAQLPQAQVQLEQIRSTSGDPIGIQIVWASVTDETVTGYHLYKSDSSISDSARGDDSLWVNVTFNQTNGVWESNTSGESIITQPATQSTVVVRDIFPVAIGEQYFYRLTSVDGDGDESRLTDEVAVTIQQFRVSVLETTSARVGDQVVITGERFGQYEPTTDFVYFPGVEWNTTNGFIPADIPAVIDEWTPDQITVQVPMGATTGQLIVEVNGTQETTPEPFNNLDPYITEITPLTGTVETPVTVRGANFDNGPNTFDYILLGGIGQNNAGNYISWTEGEIVFYPAYGGTFGSLTLAVAAIVYTSNTGYFDLTNAAPTAVITASRAEALAPADITLSTTGSSDPESPLDELAFDYDWEGDGVYDALNVGAASRSHAYTTPGHYQPTLRVTDPEGSSDVSSVTLVIANAAAIQDNGSPNAGNYYQGDGQLTMIFTLAGGVAPYTLQWYLRDSAGTLPDTLLSEETIAAAGDATHVFTIDSSIKDPVEGSDTIPLGTWQIACRMTDSTAVNDPDGSYIWPSAADFYTIYRYRAAVVQDIEGDSTGATALALYTMLENKGYHLPPAPLESTTVDITALINQSVVVWAADGPHGTVVPFDWLSAVDTALMRAYLDLGGNLVLLGPAGISAPTLFPDDAVFNSDYQPFAETSIVLALPSVTMFPRDFASNYATAITSFEYANDYSMTIGTGLQSGAVRLLDRDPVPSPTSNAIAAIRPSPNTGGGNLFFGQFTFANIMSFTPSTVADADLLDNIAAGTITY